MYVYESWYNMSQKKIEWFFLLKGTELLYKIIYVRKWEKLM